MEVWKIIFLSKWVICRFHVNLPGCWYSLLSFHHLTMACPHHDSRQLRLWKPMHCPWSSTRIMWRYASPKKASLTHIFPWRLTWNPKMEVWKMIFLFNLGDMLVPSVNFLGCTLGRYPRNFPSPRVSGDGSFLSFSLGLVWGSLGGIFPCGQNHSLQIIDILTWSWIGKKPS